MKVTVSNQSFSPPEVVAEFDNNSPDDKIRFQSGILKRELEIYGIPLKNGKIVQLPKSDCTNTEWVEFVHAFLSSYFPSSLKKHNYTISVKI